MEQLDFKAGGEAMCVSSSSLLGFIASCHPKGALLPTTGFTGPFSLMLSLYCSVFESLKASLLHQ